LYPASRLLSNSSSNHECLLVKDSARKRGFRPRVTVRLSDSIRGCGLDVATHHVPCRCNASHTQTRAWPGDDLDGIGSASDTVHVLRFPTYVRSRVRRRRGAVSRTRLYERNRHDASLSVAVNAANALSFRKFAVLDACELFGTLIK